MHYSKKRNSTTNLHLNKNALIEEIQNENMNKECFDCGSENPEYISINNGIFLCKNCIYYHYKFPDYISTLIKNNLNILGEKELKYLYYGGNKRLSNYMYVRFPNLNQYQPDLLYKSDELKHYRNKLSTIVNESEISDKKLYLTQNNFYYPMTDKRTKRKFDLDSNNNFFDNNDLKRKYNYRKIPINENHNLNEKYSSKTERPLKPTENITRKQYKKRLIPTRTPKSKDQIESYQNSPNLRQNRFFNESNYFSNDSNLLNSKAFENKTNGKFEYRNNRGKYNYTNSMINNTSNEDKYMNYSYRGQNTNRNYIRNRINANSPSNSNFYMNFKTENSNTALNSPQVPGGKGYNYNSKLSKYQSFYNKFNFQIPNKLVLAKERNKSLNESSKRVYSKPKLPKYNVNEKKDKKINLNTQKLNDLDDNNYFTNQNINNSEKIRKKFWMRSQSPNLLGKEGNDLYPDFALNLNKNTPVKLDNFEKRKIKENGINNYIFEENKKIEENKINNNINQNSINLVPVIKGEKDTNEIKEKEENGMNVNKINTKNNIEFINGNESNDNFMLNENNSKNKYISGKSKENELIVQNKLNNLKKEDLNENINNEFYEKPLDPINVMGNSNEMQIQENDEINSKDIINYLFNKKHKIRKVNRNKRNKRIVNREKEERVKMEKEEKIKKEREIKLKMEEEEMKNQFKKKFTKKERLKMIKEERLMMEQEEIQRKKEKENEDKIIKEESEEDEQDDDEKDLKPKEVEKIEERLEEEEMDLDEKDNEKESENKEEKIKEKEEEKIDRNEEKELLKYEKEININNKENSKKIIQKEDDNKINEDEKDLKEKEREKEREGEGEINEIKTENIIEDRIKKNKEFNVKLINKNKPKEINSYNEVHYQSKGNYKKYENVSNGKSTNISSENKENKNNGQNYKALDVDETFKNSIRNKYKRKRKILNDSHNQSIV